MVVWPLRQNIHITANTNVRIEATVCPCLDFCSDEEGREPAAASTHAHARHAPLDLGRSAIHREWLRALPWEQGNAGDDERHTIPHCLV